VSFDLFLGLLLILVLIVNKTLLILAETFAKKTNTPESLENNKKQNPSNKTTLNSTIALFTSTIASITI